MILTHITLSGTMQGPIWWPSGQICTQDFSKDFAAPKARKSPCQEEWQGLDEALQTVLQSGDFQGGMGDLQSGCITFHLTGPKGSATKTRWLEEMSAALPYLAKEMQ